jgi:murein DD-endopeptidase MepM/ murein hydrolase activator NlpD
MIPPSRAGALALAALTTAVAAPLALPAGAGRADEGGARKAVGALAPVGTFARPPAAPIRRLRDIDRLPRPPAPRRFFPVRAAFNWGQGAARFGADRGGRSHEGQDVMARAGSVLVAVAEGVVLETGNDGGRGNYFAMYDPRARLTYVYLHMQAPPRVGAGQAIRGGQHVGEVGCSGSCFGDHLHFEARRGRGASGAAIDPRPLLLRAAGHAGAPATLPLGQH